MKGFGDRKYPRGRKSEGGKAETRGGNACFHTFELDHYRRTDKRTDRRSELNSRVHASKKEQSLSTNLFRVIGYSRSKQFQIVIFVVVGEFGFSLSSLFLGRPLPPLPSFPLFLQSVKFAARFQLSFTFLRNTAEFGIPNMQ